MRDTKPAVRVVVRELQREQFQRQKIELRLEGIPFLPGVPVRPGPRHELSQAGGVIEER
jgi:hypothetical protein